MVEYDCSWIIASSGGKYIDLDINEALAMEKDISDFDYEVCQMLSI